MIRIRRYRVFVVGTAILLFLLFRLSQNSQWENKDRSPIYKGYEPPTPDLSSSSSSSSSHGSETNEKSVHDTKADPVVAPKPANGGAVVDQAQSIRLPKLHTSLEVEGHFGLPATKTSAQHTAYVEEPSLGANKLSTQSSTTKPTAVGVPQGISTPPNGVATSSIIHWRKFPEHFPIPTESLIPLPTGTPKAIPRIQFRFGDESASERAVREERLSQVRSEMQHAWNGYRTYAWTHDELVPISKTFRDPFCGWAASIVDALDTLWIMGMVEEFDEAYDAVKQIDFTTSPYRAEIPVFETVIRYLGGLIAAYDVTNGAEGKYPALLTKAVELAEILMGVFDTPNRMPVLYYNWKPAFVSQAKRAGAVVSVAELGSMSMEFTRLAQLTGENKYYDAINRITDAFEEWGNRGTALPGLFPEHIDASGCNKTRVSQATNQGASIAAQQQISNEKSSPVEPQGYRSPDEEAEALLAAQASQASQAEEAPAETSSAEESPATGAVSAPSTTAYNPLPGRIGKRAAGDETIAVQVSTTLPATAAAAAVTTIAVASQAVGSRPKIVEGNALPFDASSVDPPAAGPIGGSRLVDGPRRQKQAEDVQWDCIPQNLTPAGSHSHQHFGMGGSQDSTYEYFPKEYLLLGGLETKYKTLHEKTVEGVKNYLLYRPMIEDEHRDIRFSAKVSSRDGTDQHLTYSYEVTHLTCFLGGMFALGGRIFDRPEDVDIAAKLADGCVWAYQVMPSGIMPEVSMMMPCANETSCPWNQTAWHEMLDTSHSWRARQMELYEEALADWKTKKAEAEEYAKLHQQIEEEVKQSSAEMTSSLGKSVKLNVDMSGVHKRSLVTNFSKDQDSEQVNGKRSPSAEEPDLSARADANDGSATERTTNQLPLEEPVVPPEPVRPETHEEYVQNRLEREHLPPGFVSLTDRRYILRPEAIESVWYMYRITGDPIWQEKGWAMFEAICKWTRTEVGHSAIIDITRIPQDGEAGLADYMESFWFSETLKYFYLLFSEPDVISLDKWVFNTEAHPFKRPT